MSDDATSAVLATPAGQNAVVAALKELYKSHRKLVARVERQEQVLTKLIHATAATEDVNRELKIDAWLLRSRAELAEERLLRLETGRRDFPQSPIDLADVSEVSACFE